MEQNYAETCVKQKTTAKIAFLKLLLAIGVVLLLGIGILSKISILILLAVLAVVALVWYWPRFKVEWEYVFVMASLILTGSREERSGRRFSVLSLRMRM